jgi:hypothetical protein
MSKRYIVYCRPVGSKCWTIAPKDRGAPAEFHKRETAEEFIRDVLSTRKGWKSGIPNQTPMEGIIIEVELPV